MKKLKEDLKMYGNLDMKRKIIFLILILWFLGTGVQIIRQIQHIIVTYSTLGGLTDEEKREKMFRPLYNFIETCYREIPENARVLLFEKDYPHYKDYYLWMLGYHLYPRKIYRQQRPYASVNEISEEWLREKGIDYIILHNEDLKTEVFRIIKAESKQSD